MPNARFVVVRRDPDDSATVHVEAMNPQLLVDVTGEPQLQPVAEEVTTRLQAAIDALVNDELAVRNFLSTHPDSGLKIVAETPDISESVFATKKDAGIIGPVDEVITTMEADGTAKTIYDKYFGEQAAAPSTWPGSDLALQAGWRTWQTI